MGRQCLRRRRAGTAREWCLSRTLPLWTGAAACRDRVVLVNVVECGVAATGQWGVWLLIISRHLDKEPEGAFCGSGVSASLLHVGFRGKFSNKKPIQFQNSKLSSRTRRKSNYRLYIYSTQALSSESRQEIERQLEKQSTHTGLRFVTPSTHSLTTPGPRRVPPHNEHNQHDKTQNATYRQRHKATQTKPRPN